MAIKTGRQQVESFVDQILRLEEASRQQILEDLGQRGEAGELLVELVAQKDHEHFPWRKLDDSYACNSVLTKIADEAAALRQRGIEVAM